MQPPSPLPAADQDARRLFQLYVAGDFDQLSADFLRLLASHDRGTRLSLGGADLTQLLRFLKIFLTLFTQADYVVPQQYIVPFVRHNYLLSNLVAMTPLRNTDAFLELVRYQPANFVKILTLYSARNTVRFERRPFFDANPPLASLWYNSFCDAYKTGCASAEVAGHLAEHLAYRDERLVLAPEMQEPYYGSSYVHGVTDRDVKSFLNEVVRRSIPKRRCQNRPNPRKIAVISDTWLPQHSVYRNYAAFVRELKKEFHLTFFHVLRSREELDVSLFDEVHRLEARAAGLQIDALRSNDFMVVYYPDIGMSLPSIVLANLRVAPIQICSPGHSVSTWGADIDYFISGIDVETPEAPERNYSERLVLLPGMGVIHNRPLYEPTGRKKTVPEIVINCPWFGQKLNARFCATLRQLLARSRRPLRLRIFPGAAVQHNAYLPFLADVREALGNSQALDLQPPRPYPHYMGLLEEGDLTLDSFHYGGCNTIADSLFLRKPTVVWEGDKWYNRIGPAMLRLVGQEEQVCHSEEEYLDKALRLIHDDDKRAEVSAQLRAIDLDATVFSTAHAPGFLRAVKYVIANHERLQAEGSREPIVIA
jgi:hypothetical protein